MKKVHLPSFGYFIPFYGAYRLVKRLRVSEDRLDQLHRSMSDLRHDFEQARAMADLTRKDVEYMKHDSFKEVQFYEARIETIYQRLMSILDLNPRGMDLSKLNNGGARNHDFSKVI